MEKSVKEMREEMVNRLVSYIEANPLEWEKGWTVSENPHNAVSNKTYNGFNFLYLYFLQLEKGYTDGRWLTFKQAQDLGGGVKKGEKSAQIFYYREYDKNTKKDFNRKKIEELPKDEQLLYIKENVVPVLRYSNVFNAKQCENLPKVEKIAMTAQEMEVQRQAAMETVLKNNPVPITHDGGSSAYYSPREDAIHLPEMAVFKDMQNYYATALHEIAHSTGHKSRLNRNLQMADKAAYAVEELRAELGSVFVQNELGIKIEGRHFENHGAYLQSWLSEVKKDPGVFLEAVSAAGKIADYITVNYAQKNIKSEQLVIKPKELPRQQVVGRAR